MPTCRTIYYICVNYNNSNYSKKFLESISLQNRENSIDSYVAIVVDNSSEASDYDDLKLYCEKFSNATLIRSEKNVGYFGGLNIGLLSISPTVNDLVIIGNNDLVFSKEFESKLIVTEYPDDVLVVAPNVITSDGYHQNPHCPRRLSKFRKFLYKIYFSHYFCARLLTFASYIVKIMKGGRKNNLSDRSQFIHMGIGACYILTAAYFKSFSKLDDSVFLYGEEALLAGQVMSVNGKTFYDANLIVIHAESATLSKYPSRTIYDFTKKSYVHYKKYL